MDMYSVIILLFSALGLIGTTLLEYRFPSYALASRPKGIFPEMPVMTFRNGPNYITVLGQGLYTFLMLGTLLFSKGWLPFWPIATAIALGFSFSAYFLHLKMDLKADPKWQLASTLNFGVIATAAYFLI